MTRQPEPPPIESDQAARIAALIEARRSLPPARTGRPERRHMDLVRGEPEAEHEPAEDESGSDDRA